tara:strand:- start:435 stop:602 length:168 start_codon:yes stop_codon:yes gene_type:complete
MKKSDKNHNYLNLYSEDFADSKVWIEVCERLGVDYNKTDKVTIFFNYYETLPDYD